MTNDPSENVGFSDFVAILRRQGRIILLSCVIALSACVAYLAIATPMFTATALVFVDPAAKNLLDPVSVQSGVTADNARLESEVEILKSDSISVATLETTNLYLTDEFGAYLPWYARVIYVLSSQTPPAPEGDQILQDSLSRFQDALTVRRRGLTYLVAVSFTSREPALAAQVANAHAETYINAQVRAKAESYSSASRMIRTQLSEARAALAQTEQALNAYFSENLDGLSTGVASGTMQSLQEELRTTLEEKRAIDAEKSAVQASINLEEWARISERVNDDVMADLNRQLLELRAQSALSTSLDDQTIDLSVELARVDAALNARARIHLENLDDIAKELQEVEQSIQTTIRAEALSAPLPADTLTDIYGLQQDAQIARRQYDLLLNRLRDLETQSVLQIADARIISPALPPASPSTPNLKLSISIALLIGVTGGALLAFVNEFVLGGITSAQQLGNLVPARITTVVPKVSAKEGELSVSDIIVHEPMSTYAESFRRIRANIDRLTSTAPGQAKVIMVTSSIASEGKSTSALSLARTYSAAGQRTLLIDADLRNPTQHLLVGASPNNGLLEFLNGELNNASDPDFFDKDPLSKLGVLMGVNQSQVPTDAPLQSKSFEALISDARKSFDAIILDTAPLVPIVDARYVAAHADAVLLCVRYGKTSQAQLRSAYEQVQVSASETTAVFAALTYFEDKGGALYQLDSNS